MMTSDDLHGAIRAAVDARRTRADEYLAEVVRSSAGESIPMSVWESGFTKICEGYEREALAMCDWADDVLQYHEQVTLGGAALAKYDECRCINAWPCIEVLRVAAAFGVETGETDA